MTGSHEFLHLSDTAWVAITGISTAALVLATTVTAVIALRQLRTASSIWRDEVGPYIVADFEPTQADDHLIDFIVRNIGRTAAFNLQISWDPLPIEANPIQNHEFAKARMFNEPLSILPPGREYRFYFDSAIDRNGRKDLDQVFHLKIQFDDRWDNHHSEIQRLEINARQGSRNVTTRSIHDVAKTLESISQSLRNSALANGGPVRVVAETTRQAEERERRAYNEIAVIDGLDRLPEPVRIRNKSRKSR